MGIEQLTKMVNCYGLDSISFDTNVLMDVLNANAENITMLKAECAKLRAKLPTDEYWCDYNLFKFRTDFCDARVTEFGANLFGYAVIPLEEYCEAMGCEMPEGYAEAIAKFHVGKEREAPVTYESPFRNIWKERALTSEAKLAECEWQEPVAEIKIWNKGGSGEFKECLGIDKLNDGDKLYLHLPQATVPDGCKLVPIEPNENMLIAARDWSIAKNGDENKRLVAGVCNGCKKVGHHE